MVLIKIVFRLLIIITGLGLTAAIAVGAFALTLVPELPPIESLAEIKLKVPLRIYTADRQLLGEFGDERRIPISIDDVPEPLIQAVLAAEDDGFYRHPGVDIAGIIRAAVANFRSGGHGQGASTITMQVARNFFLSNEKTYIRKLKEVMLALRMEQALSKGQILELYVNKIFLGNRAYGFAAAAHVYYGKQLPELTLPEVAMLAALPKAPSRNNPLSNPASARERRNYVLQRLFDLDHIDADEFSAATTAPLTATLHITELEIDAPYVAEIARQQLWDRYGDAVYDAGYNVITTIRADHQSAAEQALRAGLTEYDRRHGYRGAVSHFDLAAISADTTIESRLQGVPDSRDVIAAVATEIDQQSVQALLRNGDSILIEWPGLVWARAYQSARRKGPEPNRAADIVQPGDIIYVQRGDEGTWRLAQIPEISGALVSLDPDTGAIVALAGGFDYYLSKFNRATQAQRQPGSNIKPFIYSAALEKGFTAGSLVSGAPIVVEDAALEDMWRPENYSGKIFGPTRLRKALSLSLNLVSVRLLRSIGIDFTRQHLARFGFDPSNLPNGLSLALGSGSLTPVELASAYAVFANGGYRIKYHLIDRVEDSDGRVIAHSDAPTVCRDCVPDSGEVGTPTSRYAPRVISAENAFIMNSLMRQVVKSGTARRALKLGRSDLAGKTGTTNNFHDAWFSGFNSDLITTVWVGLDQPGDLGRGEAGSKAALPIWVDYMKFALNDVPESVLQVPDSITTAFIHKETGEAVPSSHPESYEEFFIAGTAPRTSLSDNGYATPTSGASGSATASGSTTDELF
ncbi:MAG: penicillin-binding protein 1A [Gammaproteobacteria bacterium]|nr:penicillin-binding protein 1A [Gammaproteobacteria bacterium]MDH3465840.1 penicillin-binding protein 1A [Gammaproteobacteria bacterium]